MSGFFSTSLSAETARAVALGAAAGTVYLLVVFRIIGQKDSSFGVSKLVPATTSELLGVCYFYGGVWLTWAVPVALFVRFGTILPLGVAVLEVVLFVSVPDAGDFAGPLSMLAWPIYLVVFGLLAGAEVVSMQLVRDAGPTLLLARSVLVGGLFAGLLGLGLWRVLPVWRVFPVRKPLPLWVENDDTVAHRVTVEIATLDADEIVFAETVAVESQETVSLDDAVARVGRYRVTGELDDGTAYEFILEPGHFDRFRAVVVWVEGELGRLRILGQGTGP